MTGRNIVVIGACMAGLLLGRVTTGAFPVNATAASRTETATVALG